jgi:PAS domain S-box-containing protein
MGVRARMVLLGLLTLLPAWGLAGVSAWRFAEAERAALVRTGQDAARDIAGAVEREAVALRVGLLALATSPALTPGDIEAFDRQTRLLHGVDGLHVSLDRVEPEAPPEPPGTSRFTDLQRGADGRYVVTLSETVLPAGEGAPLRLSLAADALTFWSNLLRRTSLPKGWVASILDSRGTILARTPLPERFVGQPVHPAAAVALRTGGAGAEGWATASATRDGGAVHMAWRRLPGLSWTVLVGVPQAELDGAFRRSLLPVLLGGGVALLGLSLVSAVWGARRLARPLLALENMAKAVGRGAVPVPAKPSGLREIDAVGTALVAAAAERQEREAERLALAARLRAVLGHVPMGILLAEAPSGRIRLCNRRLPEMLGLGPGDLVGLAAHLEQEAHDEAGNRVPAAALPLARALRGEAQAQGEYCYRRGDGRLVWIRAVAAPIRGEADPGAPEGRITGAVVALAETDAERRAAEALRESELRFRTLAEAVPQIVWSTGPDGALDYVNRRFHEFVGPPRPGRGPGIQPPLHPRDRAAVLNAWREALAGGESYEAEFRLRRADGVWRWFVARALPARDAEGDLHRWIGTATDVTELVETRQALERQVAAEAAARQAAVAAAEALARSEARFRHFAEASPDVLWILDAARDRLEYLSPAFERIWGEPPPGAEPGLDALTLHLHPEDRARADLALARLRAGEPTDSDYRIRRPDGQVAWVRILGFALRDAAGGGARVGGFARDVTLRKAAEQQQRLLIGELNHRVKNTLATVLSLARQTARHRAAGAADAADGPIRAFLGDFQSRLMALARGHDLLTASTWRGAPLEEVAAAALAPWRKGLEASPGATGGGRILLQGPRVWLGPRQALGLALGLHEMATNAAKHGALRSPGGQVSLTWHRLEDGTLELDWTETGGPPARPPQRQGFGTRLLRSGLPVELGPGAEVTLDYAEDGFRARIRFRPAQEGGEE